ncbi:hypothetical protein GCM10029964_002780 [Kibdelosporangium lantanae]
MKIGFGAPVAGAWATPANLATFATKAESLGYSSLWTFHRLLVPAAPELDPVYRSVLDPLVAMSYMAARTSTIRLGVALVNFPFVSPTYLAKQASTLDVVSSGRLDLGLGAGWQQEEFIATGASMERRGARIAEYVDVLRNLWTAEVSTYSGTFYQVPPSRMAPSRYSPVGRRSCSAGSYQRPWPEPAGSPPAGCPAARPTSTPSGSRSTWSVPPPNPPARTRRRFGSWSVAWFGLVSAVPACRVRSRRSGRTPNGSVSRA